MKDRLKSPPHPPAASRDKAGRARAPTPPPKRDAAGAPGQPTGTTRKHWVVALLSGAALSTALGTLVVVNDTIDPIFFLSLMPLAFLPLFRLMLLQIEAEQSAVNSQVATAAEAVREDPLDLGKVWGLNRAEIEKYHQQTRNRARYSFAVSVVAMVAGLAVLLFGAKEFLDAETNDARAAAALFTAVGGALSSFIAATFLRTHRDALFQLSYYFHQPVVSSYVLAAERLAQQLPAGDKEASIAKMIDKLLTISDTVPLPVAGGRRRGRLGATADEEAGHRPAQT